MRNFLMKILMIFLVLVGVIGYFIILAVVEGFWLDYKYGQETVYYTWRYAFWIQMGCGCAFFGMMRYYWSKTGLKEWGDTEGIRSSKSRPVKFRRTMVSLVFLIVINFLCMQWHNRITLNEVEIHRIFLHKTYSYEDVEYFSLRARYGGELAMELHFNDGNKVNILGGDIMQNSDGFEELFPEDVYDFSPYLSEILLAQGKPLKIEDVNEMMDELKYTSWCDLANKIIEQAQEKDMLSVE